MGFFEKLKNGLKKTKQSVLGQVDNIFKSFIKVDEDMLEELEEVLIASDIGVNVTEEIIETLRENIKEKRISEPQNAKNELISTIPLTELIIFASPVLATILVPILAFIFLSTSSLNWIFFACSS